MHIFASLKSLVLTLICTGAIITGCGGGGGGGSDGSSPDGTNDFFSPAAYEEATSADESLSGVWMMLEEYETDAEYTEYNYDASSDEVTREHSETQRRALYVIADTDASPTGTPRISSCGGTEDLEVYNGRLAFSRGYVSYVADYDGNTRLTGTSNYSSASNDDYYYDRNVLRTGRFTLIKIAPLPDDFATDASSDSSYISYADFIEPVGSIDVSASEANLFGTGPFNGPVAASGDVTCFTHSETTYSVSEPSGSYSGTVTDFTAGTDSGDFDIYVSEDRPDGEEPQIEIGGSTREFWFEIDNELQDDEISGTGSVSVRGITSIQVDATVSGSEEGDADVTIEINLP